MRHAEAAPAEARQPDKLRELTQAGVKQSLHTGAWLSENNVSFDIIASSSAARAEQSASLVLEGMKLEHARIVSEDVLYDASVRQLLDYINNLEDAYNAVLCVGHNPAISYLAEYLTKAEMGAMVPCSIAVIRFDFSTWKHVTENSGTLERYLTPDVAARF
jgi:phosphohistidine phosphatase